MRPSTFEEKEDLIHHVLSGNNKILLKREGEMLQGEIVDVLLYTGSLLVKVQNQIVEIEMMDSETIH